jgi:hypothetical protein
MKPIDGGLAQAILTALFVTLKVKGMVDWSWLWVLSPLWIPVAATLAVVAIVIIGILVIFLVVFIAALAQANQERKLLNGGD